MDEDLRAIDVRNMAVVNLFCSMWKIKADEMDFMSRKGFSGWVCAIF